MKSDKSIHNPAAFPLDAPATFYSDGSQDTDAYFQEGMSLRDYFAAAAMSGIIASYTDSVKPTPNRVAEEAYLFADAMLLRRNYKYNPNEE